MAACAYWTSGGTGTGSGTTGTAAAVTVVQTSAFTDLSPGGSVELSGNFDNTANKGATYVTAVSATVGELSVTTDKTKPPCTAADFTITGTALVGADIPKGTGVGSWRGLTLRTINNGKNQDNCQKVTVPIIYTSS